MMAREVSREPIRSLLLCLSSMSFHIHIGIGRHKDTYLHIHRERWREGERDTNRNGNLPLIQSGDQLQQGYGHSGVWWDPAGITSHLEASSDPSEVSN